MWKIGLSTNLIVVAFSKRLGEWLWDVERTIGGLPRLPNGENPPQVQAGVCRHSMPRLTCVGFAIPIMKCFMCGLLIFSAFARADERGGKGIDVEDIAPTPNELLTDLAA